MRRSIADARHDLIARLALLARPRVPETLPATLDRRRVYLLPTRFGLFLAALLGTMLLGALNYNNNPAILLAFMLLAAALASLHSSHLTLSGLRLRAVRCTPVHAGEALVLHCRFDTLRARDRRGLQLRADGVAARFSVPASAAAAASGVEVELGLPTTRRGWVALPRLQVVTTMPLGLVRTWGWFWPKQSALVYPALETPAPPLPEGNGDGVTHRLRQHGEEPHHLRDYRSGDAPRQIAWKASARTGQLLVREYEATAAREYVLDWAALGALDREARIRRLARWVVEAERRGVRSQLRLPGATLGPAFGPPHRHACLRALALLPHG